MATNTRFFKLSLLITMVLLSVIGLFSCSSKPADDPSNSPRQHGLNVYKSIDYAKDSEESKLGISQILLLTDAVKNSDGTFSWDDGQSFVLRAITKDGEIDLIPYTYFQLAQIDFSTFIRVESGTFCVLVDIAGGAGYTIKEFEYNVEAKAFNEKQIYSADNINFLSTPK